MMQNVLLVGGSHDGKRVDADLLNDVIRMANITALKTADANQAMIYGHDGLEPLRQMASEVVYEDYTRRILVADPSRRYFIFALAEMPLHKVMEALINKYPIPAPKENPA
jgi:hypothetical protein